MKIFLSCPSRSTDIGLELWETLTAQFGWDVWYFFSSLRGEAERDVVSFRDNGFGNADAILVVVSNQTIYSLGVASEVKYAKVIGLPILSLVVHADAVVPDYLVDTNQVEVDIYKVDAELDKIKQAASTIQPTAKTFDRKPKFGDVIGDADSDSVRVFIAYSRKQRHVVEKLSEILTNNRISHFWDRKILVGAVWRQTIQRALDHCTHMIVIWTPDSAASDEVEREVSYALDERKKVLPILSDPASKMPYHLRGFHYVVMKDDIAGVEKDIIMTLRLDETENLWY